MNHRSQHLLFAIACLSLMAILTTPVDAAVTTFTDFTAFQSSSGATAEAPMPSTGSTTLEVVGGMTFTNHLPSTLNFKNWTSILPGFELALNDVESYNIDFDPPITGLGFDWLDVNDDQDTSFTINFYSGGAGGTNVGASTFTSNDVENMALFQGFTSTALFDRVQIREVGNDVQNEFFGQFYTGGGLVKLNTSALTITGDGDGDPNKAFGVPFTASTNNGIATFKIAGDLNIPAGVQVEGIGANGASLRVANNLNVGPGATINFSASGLQAGPGGGDGGRDLTPGGVGGNGGLPVGTPGFGGVFGAGGIVPVGGLPGFPGSAGASGIFGEVGLPDATSGVPGADGLNSSNSGGEAGTNDPLQGGTVRSGGFFGFGGDGGCNEFAQGICVSGGTGGFGGGGLVGGNGTLGDTGDAGSIAPSGTAGENGAGGLGGENTGSGTSISGGGGGGSGASGAGGGGGGSGGGGAGGGGGGGGSFVSIFPPLSESGGRGGSGGSGGIGGPGGKGGTGGRGGDGGGGGGAFEIIVNGAVTIAGQLNAQGGDGDVGPGEPGGVGINGAPGAGGKTGVNPGTGAGIGANGRPGGSGGKGGTGGRGGDGGGGGGGAGGTVKIVGSVTNTVNADINTLGGSRGNFMTLTAGDGRFIFGDNTVGDFAGAITGATTNSNNTGSRDANPFVSGSPDTPFIPDLAGGAEVYGLTGLDADTDLSAVVNAAPANSVVALVYQDVGPTGFDDDFEGFDMLLVVNLSENPLTDVTFGAGSPGFETGLLQRGVAENPDFGGDGEDALAELGSGEVYATLVPDTTNDFQISALGISGTAASMSDGNVLFLVAGIPGDFDLDDDVDGGDFLAWQRGEVSDPPSASDLADWQANFGTAPGPLTADSTVPEPSTTLLFLLGTTFIAFNSRAAFAYSWSRP